MNGNKIIVIIDSKMPVKKGTYIITLIMELSENINITFTKMKSMSETSIS